MHRMTRATRASHRPGKYMLATCSDRETVVRVLLELELEDLGRSDVSILLSSGNASAGSAGRLLQPEPNAPTAIGKGGVAGLAGGAALFGLTAAVGIGFTGMNWLGAGSVATLVTMVVSGCIFGGVVGALIGAGVPKLSSRNPSARADVASEARPEADPESGPGFVLAVRVHASDAARAERAALAAGLRGTDVVVVDRPPVLADELGSTGSPDPVLRGLRLG